MHSLQNFKAKRIYLFSLISSLELDMRSFLRTNQIALEGEWIAKAEKRISESGEAKDSKRELDLYLLFLDFGDYVFLINKFFKEHGYCRPIHSSFLEYLGSLAPIRNRIMHSRPLNQEDEAIVSAFIAKKGDFSGFFQFSALERAIKEAKNHPEAYLEEPLVKARFYISNRIENNLPPVDFDDTGFVGREEKKRELAKKVKSAHPIITVIGNGGIGKTSTVLSYVYEAIDDPNFPFEKVLWVTLKTKSLQDGEFRELKDSVRSFGECVERNEILKKEKVTTIENLLFYMEAYKTLLILDNLETINQSEVRELLEELPAGSKIIITSRIGVGEFESRLVLDQFSEKEALAYFRRLVTAYGVKAIAKIDDGAAKSFLRRLYYSPLCIKWFVINVGKGGNPDMLVNSQDELIEFCLSNVFEKLSEEAKTILMILSIKRRALSLAQIVYINDSKYTETTKAINELIACYFLEQKKAQENYMYDIPEFSAQYLAKRIDSSSARFLALSARANRLFGILEQATASAPDLGSKKPHQLFPKTPDEKIATIYMLSLIECAEKKDKQGMAKNFELAQQAAPNFADVYRVAAFCYSTMNEFGQAKEFYEQALTLSEPRLLPSVQYYYSLLLLDKFEDYEQAELLIKQALAAKENDAEMLFVLARIQKRKKEYREALKTITKVLEMCPTLGLKLVRLINAEHIDIQVRLLDNQPGLDKARITLIVELITQIPQKYYSVQLFNAIGRFFNTLSFLSGKWHIKGQYDQFLRSNVAYVLFVNENIPAVFSKANNLLTDPLDPSSFTAEIPINLIGTVEAKPYLGKYGAIAVKGTKNKVYFEEKDVGVPLKEIGRGTSVRMFARFRCGKWFAQSIGLLNNGENL